jgi:hypothetical protein
MRTVTIFGLATLGLVFAFPAQALTISNTDAAPHTITVKTSGDSKQLTIAPQTEVEAPCSSGCTVELENGEQYEMQGGEDASIEDGSLFVDAAPGEGGGGGAPASGASGGANAPDAGTAKAQ